MALSVPRLVPHFLGARGQPDPFRHGTQYRRFDWRPPLVIEKNLPLPSARQLHLTAVSSHP